MPTSFSEEPCRASSGINKVTDTVASTLGPKGRNVVLEKKFARRRSPMTA